MIQHFYPEESKECTSTGCSCCAVNYNINDEKDEILDEAKQNIKVVKKICKHYNISFVKFCQEVKDD